MKVLQQLSFLRLGTANVEKQATFFKKQHSKARARLYLPAFCGRCFQFFEPYALSGAKRWV